MKTLLLQNFEELNALENNPTKDLKLICFHEDMFVFTCNIYK